MQKTSNLIVILLSATALLIPGAWWLVERIETKHDWFLFVEFSQKPKWYVHYTCYHISNIIQLWIIHILTKIYLPFYVSKITIVFLGFGIFRLIEYWLFRHHIPLLGLVGGIIIYSLGTLFFYQKKWPQK